MSESDIFSDSEAKEQPNSKHQVKKPSEEDQSKSSVESESDEDSKEAQQSLSAEKQREFRAQHPQRNTFDIDGIVISSDFCSGNLKHAEKWDDGWIALTISVDGAPYTSSGLRSWFYFSVTGVQKKTNLNFIFPHFNF